MSRRGKWIAVISAATAAAVLTLLAIRNDVTIPADLDGVRHLLDRVTPAREAWYALPLVAAAYVVLGLVLVPVLLLIAATGLLFGPWLGPIYAFAGCLASASAGFAIGRWAGYRRVQRLGGRRVAELHDALERNGTLAVFVMRKIPAPFTLTNIVAGASRVRYRDFLIGTVLGMGVIVVALAAFGYRLSETVRNPSWTSALLATLFLGVPFTLAWFINRTLKRRRAPEHGHA